MRVAAAAAAGTLRPTAATLLFSPPHQHLRPLSLHRRVTQHLPFARRRRDSYSTATVAAQQEDSGGAGGEAEGKASRRRRARESPEGNLRHQLDMCSRNADLTTALRLYDAALSPDSPVPLSLHHYNCLLYLCSNAAASDPDSSADADQRGFNIFARMEADGVQPNEAALTSVARLAAATRDPAMDFANSLTELAIKREARDDFLGFQSWLSRHGPFDAVIDAANVGLYNSKAFSFSQVNSVVNAIQRITKSNKLPLIILHWNRVNGGNAKAPYNQKILESWRKAGALYATPPGSNDDWYWLYAAVSCRSLLVTNDEMRDHLFQLLGTSFFPRWKEKHQVRLTFSGRGPTLHLPPPYSIVIQDSEDGSWHVPTTTGDDIEKPRQWICSKRKSWGAHAHQVLGGTHALGFCSVARCSADDQADAEPPRFTVVPGDTAVDGPGTGAGVGVSEAAERVCRVVSTQPELGIASALDALRVAVSPELVAEVLKNLSNAGMLALAFFRWAERQEGFRYTAESFHNLIEALGKIKQFRLVWSLVETMRCRCLLSKDTFKLIVRRYARARKVKEAVETFEKMSSFGLKTELSDYNWLIDTLSKSKQVKKGHAVYNEMKRKGRFVPDLKTYTVLMEGWGHEKDLLMVKTVYQEMLDAGIRPDVVAYGMLISAFCKSGKCDEAVKVFHEMEVSGCMPSPHVYCMLINGLGSEERLDEALKYFELYKESGFPMEVPTCNAVVGAYCRASKFQHAFKMVDEMRKCKIGPNSRTYDIILHHLIKSQKFEEAYDVFHRMGSDSCEPQLNTYTMMVGMFCSNGRVDMALKVWKQMKEKGVLPCMHMFSALINGLCFENRLEEACIYFQEMLDKGIRPPGQLFSNLKEALVEGGRISLAQEMALKLDTLRKTPLHG